MEIRIGDGFVSVSEGGSENAGIAVLICPEHGVGFAAFFALSRDERFGVGPELFDDVEFVYRRNPVCWEIANDWVVSVDDRSRVVALVIVATGGYAEEFAPVVNLGGTICMHRAMNDDRGSSGFMGADNFGNVGWFGGVRVALVVDDDIVVS